MRSKPKFVVASIIPTGIRCSVGGYIGDATQATNMLASACDYLITHPNAVNAGAFNFKVPNVLYVEGYAIDKFFEGGISLSLPKKNKIGIVIEHNKDPYALAYIQKAIEGFRLVAGVDVIGLEYASPVRKTVHKTGGQFCGDLFEVEHLVAAAKKLKKKGADAIAISTHIPLKKKDIRAYQKGKVPNPYGLIEALISHSIVSQTGLPAAHAPLLTKKEVRYYLFDTLKDSDPRGALENICGAYIGSVLIGLDSAPALLPPEKGEIGISNVSALVVPSHCLRGLPVAEAERREIPIIEVMENENIFKNYPFKLNNVIRVKNYSQAKQKIAEMRDGR